MAAKPAVRFEAVVDRPCPMCAEPVDDRARFCSACGVRLDAPIVFDGMDPAVESTQEADGATSRRFSAVLVPITVAAVLGVGALLLFATGGDDGADDDTTDEVVDRPGQGDQQRPIPSPTPTMRATPTSFPTPTPRPPLPSAPPAPVGEPADLSGLPQADATHLVVLRGSDLGFLDLSSGAWTVHERLGGGGGSADQLIPFGSGVTVNGASGAVHVRVDGPPTPLGQGWAIGSFDGLLWVQPWQSDGLTGSTLVGLDENASEVDEIDLPAGVWPAGVLPSNGIVVWAGGQVYVVDRSGAEVMSTGMLLGVADGQVLVQTCGGNLECSVALLEPEVGSAFDVEVVPLNSFLQLVGRDTIVVHGTGRPAVYRVVDGALVEDEDALFNNSGRVLPDAVTTTDTTGLYARADGGRVLFHGPTGDVLTELEPPFNPRATITELRFITADTTRG